MSSTNPDQTLDRASKIYAEFQSRDHGIGGSLLADLCELYPDLAEELRVLDAQHATIEFQQSTEGGSAEPASLYGARVIAAHDAGRQYEVRAPLGKGGMGVVLRVWDDKLHRELAMKMVRGQEPLAAGESVRPVSLEHVARFVREAEITARLDHPGIVPIHELGNDEHGHVFFTMRLIEGMSLADVLRAVRQGHARWTQTRVLDVILKVCEAIAFAHSRFIIHRDLKPANIMVGRFGETYVMDWGLAKVLREFDSPAEKAVERRSPLSSEPSGEETAVYQLGSERLSGMTMDGSVLGTPSYMSPEQAEGRIDALDERSDIYSVGAILYELLAGQRPYADSGTTQSAYEIINAVRTRPPTPILLLKPRAHAELVAICEKATARAPEDRYQSMQDMAEDLRAYLERRVVRAYQTGAVAELKKWVARNRGVAIATVAALLVSAGLLLWVVRVQSVANKKLFAANKITRAALGQETKARERETAAKEIAETQRNRAEGLLLARESADTLETHPTQALLLALESNARQPSFEANTAILAALDQHYEHRTLLGHREAILSHALSSDGSRAVTASKDRTAIVWDLATGEAISWLVGHTGWVYDAQFSPDKRSVLTASGDNTAALWNAETGELLRKFVGHEHWVFRAAFSPDGARAATASFDKTVRIWDTSTGKALFVLRGHTGSVTSVAFNLQGTAVVSAAADKTARVWDASTGEPLLTLRGHTGGVGSALFSPDGRQILTTGSFWHGRVENPDEPSVDHTARLWDAETGKSIRVLEHPAPVVSAAFSHSGKQIATGAGDGVVRVWDAATGGRTHALTADGPAVSVEFDPGDRRLAAGIQRGSVWVWDLAGEIGPAHFRAHTEVVKRVSFRSPEQLVTASEDRTARIWNVRAIGHVEGLGRSAGGVSIIAINHDGSRLSIRGNLGKSVALASFPDGRRLALLSHDKRVIESQFNAAGDLVATCDESGLIRAWSAVDGKLRYTLARNGKPAYLRFIGEDRLVLLSPSEHTLSTWNARTGEMIERLGGEQFSLSREGRFVVPWSPASSDAQVVDLLTGRQIGKLTSVIVPPQDFLHTEFSPDGRRFITLSAKHSLLRLWDTATGRLIAEMNHPQSTIAVAFSPDGKVFVTGSPASYPRLWDAENGKEVGALAGHEQSAEMIFVGPFALRMLISSAEKRTRLWNGREGRSIALLADRDEPLRNATFSRDGRRLLTLHGKTTGGFRGDRVVLWDASLGRRLAVLSRQREAFAGAAFSPDSRWIVTGNDDVSAKVWPVSPAEFAQTHVPRVLTPDEYDLFHIGAEENRARYRRTSNLQETARFLALASKATTPRANRDDAGAPNDDARPVVRAAVERILDELLQSLHPEGDTSLGRAESARVSASSRKPAAREGSDVGTLTNAIAVDRAAALEQVIAQLSQRGAMSWMVAMVLAEKLRACGQVTVAERLLSAALESSDIDDVSFWTCWAACSLFGGRRSPAELLAWMRERAGTVAKSQPSKVHGAPPLPPAGSHSTVAQDIEWLLARLAASEPIRIHAGGDDFVAADGTPWRRDCFFGGGYRFGESFDGPSISTEPIEGADDGLLYQTERWFDRSRPAAERGYHIPLPPGRYLVRLHFAEIYFHPPEGRVIDVLAEDELKLDAYSLLAVGFAKADTKQFETRVDDGLLDLEFRARGEQNAKVSAIEIERLGD